MAEIKKRLAITISYSFSIRYLYRSGLLHNLAAFCTPVICITWNQEDLIEELRQDGFEVHVVPENIKYPKYGDVRTKLDLWFKNFRIKSPSRKLQANYLKSLPAHKTNLLSIAREKYNYLKLLLPYSAEKLLATEKKFLTEYTNYDELSRFVDMLNIDAVFTLTPFHRQEDIFLRVCKDKRKLMITSILSFDNITKRGWIPVEYDVYMVWNKYNKAELKRIYPFVPENKISIVGAIQFDFYFNSSYIMPRQQWLDMVGIKESNKKIILYAGGPRNLFPHEADYVETIDKAITEGKIKGAPVILFRCHPIDEVSAWKERLAGSRNIVFDKSWTGEKNLGEANITAADIKKLCSTLYYTDLHVNICSTMTVDGSAYNKPQIGPAYYTNDSTISNRLYKIYWQEHFVPIMQTNTLALAKSAGELVSLINNNLNNPSVTFSGKAILENIITYTDGKSKERVTTVIKQALA